MEPDLIASKASPERPLPGCRAPTECPSNTRQLVHTPKCTRARTDSRPSRHWSSQVSLPLSTVERAERSREGIAKTGRPIIGFRPSTSPVPLRTTSARFWAHGHVTSECHSPKGSNRDSVRLHYPSPLIPLPFKRRKGEGHPIRCSGTLSERPKQPYSDNGPGWVSSSRRSLCPCHSPL
jgi:hypothetical protein